MLEYETESVLILILESLLRVAFLNEVVHGAVGLFSLLSFSDLSSSMTHDSSSTVVDAVYWL